MKTISLFLISLVVSANLYANESSKSKNEYENNNDHMGNHIHDGKMTNHMNMNGMTDEEMKNMHKNMSQEEIAYAGTIRTASRFTSGHSAGVDSDS